jgi:segregation and condensation protein A
MACHVQTAVFEGPFDLLLHLILSQEVDIYEVSLTSIVDTFLVELAAMEQIDLEVATEFLLIAATLVELKARSLLPAESDIDLDDELALWEERDLLLSRLLECKTFKDAAHTLQAMAAEAARSYPRTAGLEENFFTVAPDLLAGIDADDIANAYRRAMTPRPVPTVDLFHVNPIRLTVAEAVEELVDELPRAGRISFRELTADMVERLEVVVRFLALLELFKQGYIDVMQATAFGDIQILWIGGDDGADADLALIDVYEG